MLRRLVLIILALGVARQGVAQPPQSESRSNLVQAILTEDATRQIELIRGLSVSHDPLIEQAMVSWRQGGVFVFETNETRVPFLLDSQTDPEGKAKGIKIVDGEVLKDSVGKPLLFLASDLTAADTSSKVRKAIKITLDLFALVNPDPKMRRDAVIKLGEEQNSDYVPYFRTLLPGESSVEVHKALQEAIALTEVNSTDETVRVNAINRLREMNSINALSFLQELQKVARSNPAKYGEATRTALQRAISGIESYMRVGNLFGTAFRGLSTSAVLLVAALGLAITFGLMGVINMAHGEIMMVGAYSAFVMQNIFISRFGSSGTGFDCYFIAALAFSFLMAALVGLLLERGVIRFLYKRPLESLLATWGVSMVLQQIFRHVFGAANVQVNSPSWLSGSFVIKDVLLGYNRLFVIGFAVFVLLLTYWLMTRTGLGLQIRAVMQNRSMASALGVRADRVNMMTFAFGSGLAGMAGACLSQIANVGPRMGQDYIVDCFMVVVLGGVGNLVGTSSASLGIGVTDQILQPWLGAVMGKITVLAAIILFLQWRPAGIFVTRSRSLEG